MCGLVRLPSALCVQPVTAACGVRPPSPLPPAVMPSSDKPCSLFRGTCPGSVEKRIRGIVPPNLDIVGSTAYGGLRYCKRAATFSTLEHYFKEEDIMMVGQVTSAPPFSNGCRIWKGLDACKRAPTPPTLVDHAHEEHPRPPARRPTL